MSGGNDFDEKALWRRWRDGRPVAGEAGAEPDALTLAAYAEHRLGRAGGDPEADPAVMAVEAWLADHPEALDDIIAARAVSDPPVGEALIARAQAMVARPEGNVVGLRPRRAGWRYAATWSGVAASMVLAVLVGFSLGNANVFGLPEAAPNPVLEQALIGTQSLVLVPDDEDSGI